MDTYTVIHSSTVSVTCSVVGMSCTGDRGIQQTHPTALQKDGNKHGKDHQVSTLELIGA